MLSQVNSAQSGSLEGGERAEQRSQLIITGAPNLLLQRQGHRRVIIKTNANFLALKSNCLFGELYQHVTLKIVSGYGLEISEHQVRQEIFCILIIFLDSFSPLAQNGFSPP